LKNDKTDDLHDYIRLAPIKCDNKKYALGITHLKEDKIDNAKKIFEYLLIEYPKCGQGSFGIGSIYALKGQLDLAVEMWEKALEIDPDMAEAHFALAWVYYQRKESEKANRHINNTLNSGSNFDNIKALIEKFPVSEMGENEKKTKRSILSSKYIIKEYFVLLMILGLAIIVRLYYYYFIIPLDFHIDTYHHWQISYFTLKIGIPKYLFFYDPGAWMTKWMPLFHIVEIFLLYFNKSIDTIRLFNIFLGASTSLLLYKFTYILYKNKKSAYYSALLYTVFPLIITTDIQALTEPLTIFLIFSAFICMYQSQDIFSGILWCLASLCRQEIFSVTLVVVFLYYIFHKKSLIRLFKFLISYILLFSIYFIIYKLNGFNPMSPINPWIHKMMLLDLFGYEILYFYLMIGIVISSLHTYYWWTKKKLSTTVTSIHNKLRNNNMLPIYAFLTVYFIGLTSMIMDIPNVHIKIFNIIVYNLNENIDITGDKYTLLGIFRYSSIPLSLLMILLPRATDKVSSHIKSDYLKYLLIAIFILLNFPISNFYSKFQTIPTSYFSASQKITSTYYNGTIIVDNQYIIYDLIAHQDISPNDILGSYWANNTIKAQEKDVNMIIFTSISWDGANLFFKRIPEEQYHILHEISVPHVFNPGEMVTLYAYGLIW